MEFEIRSKTYGVFKCLIDNEDAYLLDKYKYRISSERGRFYVRTRVNGITVYFHRLILGINNPKVQIDHINHDGTDNRRCNLRPVNHSQNQQNSKKCKDGTSIYKGVFWWKGRPNTRGRWCARIICNGESHWLGYFDSEIEAAKAYNTAAEKYFGEYANLNEV